MANFTIGMARAAMASYRLVLAGTGVYSIATIVLVHGAN